MDSDRAGEATAGVPWGSPALQGILASTLVLPLGVPLLSPALPAIRDALALTDARASLLITAYFLPGVVLSPLIGLVADRLGRRRVLIPSLVVFGVTGGLIVLRPGFVAILLLRAVQGTAAAGVFILTVTYISDLFDGLRRNAVLGANLAVLFTGAALYPTLGGALVGFGWNVLFATYLVAIPVAILCARVLYEPVGGSDRRGLAYIRGALSALPIREIVALYGATLLVEALGFGAILTALPFVLAGTYGVSPVGIGLVITVSTAVTAIVALGNGRFAARASNHRLVAVGLTCIGASLVGIRIAGSPIAIAAFVVLFGVGLGLSLPSIDAAISRRAPAEFRAGALSLRNSTTFLGRSTGPIVFAGAAAVIGYPALLLAAGIGTFAVGGVGLVATRRAQDGARAP